MSANTFIDKSQTNKFSGTEFPLFTIYRLRNGELMAIVLQQVLCLYLKMFVYLLYSIIKIIIVRNNMGLIDKVSRSINLLCIYAYVAPLRSFSIDVILFS